MTKKKYFFFINKKSGSQEGNIFLKIALQNNRNFPIDEFDVNLFNEIYQNILIVKINSKNFAKNIDQIEDV